MARNTRTFIDLDLAFTAHPTTGDVVRKIDENAIKASLKNLILTMNYERPFHSEIGSQVRAILFEPASPMTEVVLKRTIEDVILNFEPRIIIDDLTVSDNSERNAYHVMLQFRIVNTERPIVLNISLQRVR